MGVRSRAREIASMIKSPSRLFRCPSARIVAIVAMLLTLPGCGAVVEEIFEGEVCPDRAREVGRVTVTPQSWTMVAGDTVTVRADIADRQGNWSLCLPVATWTSSDSTVAVVRESFPLFEPTRAVAFRPGAVYLKAVAQSQRDSVRITVTPR